MRKTLAAALVAFLAAFGWSAYLAGQQTALPITYLDAGTFIDAPRFTTPLIFDTTRDHQYTIGVSELTADRTITLPLLTGNDTIVTEAHTATLTNKTLTSPTVGTSLIFDETTADLTMTADDQTVAATVNWPDLNGVGAGAVVSSACKLDVTDGHDSAVGTSTCTVELPAGSVIYDIQVMSTVVWNSGTSDTLDVGDDDDPDGWFSAINMQAAGELLVGESLSAAASGDATNSPGRHGGVAGAYLVETTGRMGRTTAGVDSGNYLGAATEVIAALTTVGTVPTTGTTYVIVLWSKPTEIASVYAAT